MWLSSFPVARPRFCTVVPAVPAIFVTMYEELLEALATGMIVRVRRQEPAKIEVGQAWSMDPDSVRLRTLDDRRYRDIPLDDIVDVEIIGIFLKDFGS